MSASQTPSPHPEPRPASLLVDAELTGEAIAAQIVRFDIPARHDAAMSANPSYQINMCLSPRPLNTRACYPHHWGPHRFERVGDIFMVPPGEELQFRGESGRQASLTCQLRPGLVTELIGQPLDWDAGQLAATLDITSARVRALLFRMTEEVHLPGLAAERMLEMLGGELAIEIARFCLEVHERPVTGGLASWRLRLIDERLTEATAAPSLAELAGLCKLSVRQLTRGFRISRGCSIGDYIEQRRMEAAKRLLVSGESVKTIGFAMGYASPASFSFAFRRAVGISPGQFRQRQLRGVGL